MEKYLLVCLCFGVLFANSSMDDSKNEILQKQVKAQMEKEKKYAKEQKFYNADQYDFSGAEVNPESVKKIHDIEVEDLDMDDVYD